MENSGRSFVRIAAPMVHNVINFLRETLRSRRIVLELAREDFRSRYLGSYLGIVWAFVNPLAVICVFWFVFDMGFKAQPMAGVPFVLWLVSGIVPWFFFHDSWSSANGSILESRYLVSKVVFRVSLLPMVKIASALAVHAFLVLVTVAFFWLRGHPPHPAYLQIPYYTLAMIALLLGLSWLTSSLTVFIRDLGQALSLVLQLLFWLTPILWSPEMLPERFRGFIRLNPVCYIVEGYRDSFISHGWFWDDPAMMAYYWSVTGCVLLLGAYTFMRLRPHFADVI